MTNEEYLTQARMAGARAVGLLEALYNSGQIPDVHRKFAAEIISEWPKYPPADKEAA